MLRGYRGIIVAFAGLSLIVMAMGIGAYFGALYSPHKKQYQTVNGGHTSDTEYSGPSQSLTDISGIPGPAERAIANPQPTSGEDHEKRDLAAQESMSVWAFWMMLVAAFSAIVTTIGTIFLYKQIRLTREAVEDTGKATLAMEAQNTLTKDTAERQLRAYVGFKDIEIEHLEDGTGFRLKVVIWNSGQTPAYKLRSIVTPYVCMGDVANASISFNSAPPPLLSVITLFPGQNATIRTAIEIVEADREFFQSGDLKIMFAGAASYRDAFGRLRRTTFKNILLDFPAFERGGDRKLSACARGNVAN